VAVRHPVPACGPRGQPRRTPVSRLWRPRAASPGGSTRGQLFLQLLGEHDDDAAGAPDIGEPVDVLVGRHAPRRVAAVPRGDLDGQAEVVDREGHAVHADLVGPGGLGLDRVGVEVLEELEATVAVWRHLFRSVGCRFRLSRARDHSQWSAPRFSRSISGVRSRSLTRSSGYGVRVSGRAPRCGAARGVSPGVRPARPSASGARAKPRAAQPCAAAPCVWLKRH
jgi:hypothetical protein